MSRAQGSCKEVARSTLDLFAKESRVPHLHLSPRHLYTTLATLPEVSALRSRVQGKARCSTSPRDSCAHFADWGAPWRNEALSFCVLAAPRQPGTQSFPCTSLSLHPSFLLNTPPEPLENSLEQRSRSHHQQCSVPPIWLLISQPHPPTPLCPHLPLLWGHQTFRCCPPPSLCTCCSFCTCPPANAPGQPPREPASKKSDGHTHLSATTCAVSTAGYVTAPRPWCRQSLLTCLAPSLSPWEQKPPQ